MVAAIIFALFIHFRSRLWNSRLARGGYGASITSWLFASVGGVSVAALGVLYVKYKVEGFENSESGFWGVFSLLSAFSSIGIAGVTVLLYQVVAVVSVWRATGKKHVSFLTRWWLRYLLCFNLMLGFFAAMVSVSGLVGGVVLYFTVWYFWLRKRQGGRELNGSSVRKLDSENASITEGVIRDGSISLVDKVSCQGEPQLADYLSRIKPLGMLADRVHVFPGLPVDKLKAAINARSLKSALDNQKSWLLIDDSKNLDGKTGLLVTDEFFDFNPSRSDGYTFHHAVVIELFEVSNKVVSRHGKKCFEFANFSEDDVQMIFCVVNEFFRDRESWWRLSAQNGDRDAQFKLSASLQDNVEKMHWLRKAAESGHPIAQGNLGAQLESTASEEAFHWLTLSAEQGNEYSGRRLSDPKYEKYRTSVV